MYVTYEVPMVYRQNYLRQGVYRGDSCMQTSAVRNARTEYGVPSQVHAMRVKIPVPLPSCKVPDSPGDRCYHSYCQYQTERDENPLSVFRSLISLG
jgi:hypothetical protein